MKHLLIIGITCAVLWSCAGKNQEEAKTGYSSASEQLNKIASCVESLTPRSSVSEFQEALEAVEELSFDYNPIGLDSVNASQCSQLQKRIAEFKTEAIADIERLSREKKIVIISNDDLLMDGKTYYAAALQKGDTFHYCIKSKSPISLRIINADSKTIERTISKKATIEGSMSIEHSAVYYFELNPGAAKYVDISLSYSISSASRLESLKSVSLEKTDCSKGDFLASGVNGIKTIPIFEGARAFTLSSQLKSIFSGSERAVVPVIIPSGAKEIIYSLRIATSQKEKSTDGKFDENVNYSYHKVRFLGLPVWESSRRSSIIDMVLDDNRPLREEDCYCCMYVIRNQSSAKKFQDGLTAITDINYDVDYSMVGTQSCNGRIPVNGNSKIYLAFLNERMRFTCYIWVEVSALIPTTEYFTYSYSLEDYHE